MKPFEPRPSPAHAAEVILAKLTTQGFLGRVEALSALVSDASIRDLGLPDQHHRHARPADLSTRPVADRSVAAQAIRQVVGSLMQGACSRNRLREAVNQVSGTRLTSAEREQILAEAIATQLRHTRTTRCTTRIGSTLP
jgi:hypothetical protein